MQHLARELAPNLTQRRALAVLCAAYVAYRVRQDGVRALVGSVLNSVLSAVPGAQGLLEGELQKEVDKTLVDMFHDTEESKTVPLCRALPEKGLSTKEILRRLHALETLDKCPDDGKLFALVYAWGAEHDHKEKEDEDDEEQQEGELPHWALVKRAFMMFIEKNALNPIAFPSLRRMENEVVAMAVSLMNGDDEACGTMTSGGTESICMAVKAYRDKARKERGVTRPNMVIPVTAHPAFEKAAHYFLVEVRHAPTTPNHRADVAVMRTLVDSNTICVVGSAPQYPHGVVDPIAEIGLLAQELGIPCHVDACVGGYLLPWIERLGFEVPTWDFRVPGVTSISADVHKYGYTLKGASTILYRSEEYRKYQFFSFAGWPGGLFVSPSMLGTRNGGAIAACWTAMMKLGQEGFMRLTKEVMETRRVLESAIQALEGVEVMGQPHATILTFRTKDVNVYAVADRLEEEHGWTCERQQSPPCVHLSLMPVHSITRDELVSNLNEALSYVRAHPEKETTGSAAMYGMVGSIPSGQVVENFLNAFFRRVFKL